MAFRSIWGRPMACRSTSSKLLDLLGDRGWELVIATVSRAAAGSGSAPAGADIPAADPAGMGRESYRITFKRPRPA